MKKEYFLIMLTFLLLGCAKEKNEPEAIHKNEMLVGGECKYSHSIEKVKITSIAEIRNDLNCKIGIEVKYSFEEVKNFYVWSEKICITKEEALQKNLLIGSIQEVQVERLSSGTCSSIPVYKLKI